MELTPPQQRRKAPGQRVQPDEGNVETGALLRGPLYGLQGLGDHNVAIDGDGQEVYHGGYSKPSSTESIDFTACGEIRCEIFLLSSKASEQFG